MASGLPLAGTRGSGSACAGTEGTSRSAGSCVRVGDAVISHIYSGGLQLGRAGFELTHRRVAEDGATYWRVLLLTADDVDLQEVLAED